MKSIKINCKTCNKEYSISLARYKTGKYRYCSRPCYWEVLKLKVGEANPLWRGVKRNCIVCSAEFTVHVYKSKPERDGIFCSRKCFYKGRKQSLGADHHNWKGDKVSYSALHHWIARHKGKAKTCTACGSIKNVEWANISKEYKRDLDDYKELCTPCHAAYDNNYPYQNKMKYENVPKLS